MSYKDLLLRYKHVYLDTHNGALIYYNYYLKVKWLGWERGLAGKLLALCKAHCDLVIY